MSLVTKMPLQPESSIVNGGAGPSVAFSVLTSLVTFKLLLWVLGVPRSQVLRLVGSFSWPPPGLRLFRLFLGLRLFVPPIRLLMVASF